MQTLKRQPGITLGIIGTVGVLTAIDLNHQACLQTHKIQHIEAKRMLPSELGAIQLPATQPRPHQPLSIR